ncbi:hypothetical protein SDC9_147148 [bioreactor metagenome]|uniref:Uncharacterized protein n=1 Tax=bioreactor metagenome TaxID=1076179 RepID=A0A645EGR9_9ZZZZ
MPIPKHATPANSANNTPNHFCPRPLSKAYIGPPIIEPVLSFTLYLIANKASPYFVAIPKRPVNQHQKIAPGPPKATAVATPTILPVPTVAASAVQRSPKLFTSPLPSFLAVKISFNASGRRITCNICNLIVRKIPVPTSSMRSGGPHTKLSILSKTFTKSMSPSPSKIKNKKEPNHKI